MKTILIFSLLLCAAFAAPAEEEHHLSEEVPQEDVAAAPADVVEEEAAAPEVRLSCERGWEFHGFQCFKFFPTAKSWYDAEEQCNSLDAHLASVPDPRQYSFLQQLTQPHSIAWLGGFNLQGRWMWIDRQGFYYTNWHSQVSSTHYPCMYLRSNLGWGNHGCTTKFAFICAKSVFGC
ncbi:galactose-specific lectin nattectin-like [Leuresthes tenuis]|uniref:galactose-specific lectin nattectin-like n=1 Tax=Leuresthes tenuis TaxID=355514 RepID=UPI003B50C23C